MTTAQTTDKTTTEISVGRKLGISALNKIMLDMPNEFETSVYKPEPQSNYILNSESAKQVSAFLKFPMGDALYIFGPTGSGKTSGLIEISARLGWPAQSVNCHGRMELSDLIGFPVPVARDGISVFEFQYGPLALAMKHGHILILNEIDLVDPGELAGLNEILEGRPLVIGQNGGEVIVPHPMFRVIATGNTNGSGDDTGDYADVQKQNMAAMDRYRMMYEPYPVPEVEAKILAAKAPNIMPLHKGMIGVANLIRSSYESGEGKPDAPRLSLTMSTRTIIRWANVTQLAGQSANALEKGLESALLLRGTPQDREAILRLAKDTFGEQWG